jgi:predicted Zn-dependent protease with MMP-like domain
MRIPANRFEELVADALDELPDRFLERMNNVEVVVEDYPTREISRRFPGLLLGLYHGVPLPKRTTMATGTMPDIIYIYKRNIERICSNEQQVKEQVRATVMHEIGHHFGLDEDELRDV